MEGEGPAGEGGRRRSSAGLWAAVIVLVLAGGLGSLVLAFALEEWFHPSGWQEGHYLMLVASIAAVAAGAIAAYLAKSRGGDAGWVGLLTAVLTFAVAWAPLILLLILYPPT